MATFHMTLNGPAGTKTPVPVGKLAGAPVLSYVWPTSLDPSTVGFEAKTGILALAATSHPDFDDTPLYDENGDGNLANDGAKWHSHWIVLTPTKACGEGKLAVRDIPKGQTPALPATWPGLPLFIDSPGYTPLFNGPDIAIKVAFRSKDVIAGASYDGVTSAFEVRVQLIAATQVLNLSAGVSYCKVFRGLSFSSRAIQFRCACECTERSVPFGI